MPPPVSRTYHERFLHSHFMAVHLAGFAFGLHLAVTSAFAVYHHARRSPLGPRLRLRPPQAERMDQKRHRGAA